MAEENEPLVSEEDFQECFAHASVYGELPGWPIGRTILIYKIGQDNWETLENEPGRRHAESVLLGRLDPVENAGEIQVEIYSSYSPCSECSTELIQFIEANPNYKFRIYFSNFNRHYIPQNMAGLRNLQQRVVELAPVIGDLMWEGFLQANRVPIDNQQAWLQFAGRQARRDRENDDQQIFNNL